MHPLPSSLSHTRRRRRCLTSLAPSRQPRLPPTPRRHANREDRRSQRRSPPRPLSTAEARDNLLRGRCRPAPPPASPITPSLHIGDHLRIDDLLRAFLAVGFLPRAQLQPRPPPLAVDPRAAWARPKSITSQAEAAASGANGSARLKPLRTHATSLPFPYRHRPLCDMSVGGSGRSARLEATDWQVVAVELVSPRASGSGVVRRGHCCTPSPSSLSQCTPTSSKYTREIQPNFPTLISEETLNFCGLSGCSTGGLVPRMVDPGQQVCSR